MEFMDRYEEDVEVDMGTSEELPSQECAAGEPGSLLLRDSPSRAKSPGTFGMSGALELALELALARLLSPPIPSFLGFLFDARSLNAFFVMGDVLGRINSLDAALML